MVIRLSSETESRIEKLAATTGCTPENLVEDAMAGHLTESSQIRTMLDNRYDDIKTNLVQPIDGEEVFRQLRQKSKNRRNS
jgi:hypothetical protein